MPECPRQLRVRNVLCCVLLLLVVVLIYYGSVTYRMPWEAASRGKVRAAHKGSKNGVFYFQEDTRFRKNKSQRQKQKEWKIPSTRFQRNKTRGKKGKKAFMAGAQSADRPSFEVRDKPSRDGGNPWKKNQDPFKTFPALRVKNTMSESEIRLKTTQRPRQKDPILGRNDKNSRKAENPWNRNQVPFLRNQPLELKNKISEYSGKENQMYFQKSQPPELRNKLRQNSELAWKKNQEPFRKDQTLGLKDKLSRNSTIPWKKNQEPFRKDLTLGLRDKLLRNSTIPWKKNQEPFWKDLTLGLRDKLLRNSTIPWKKKQEPFRKDQTVERKDKISRNSVIPWKKNQTQWQEKKTMGSPGIPFSKDKPLDYKDKTAQRPRKLEMPDDWSEFFVPRSQKQFSLKYSYKYPAKDVCKTTPGILVMVLSTPKNRLRRQAIRDTWGSVVRTRTWPGPTPHALPRSFKMVFLLGEKKQPGSGVSEAVRGESEKYGDIVQWNGMRDSTFNLTLKARHTFPLAALPAQNATQHTEGSCQNALSQLKGIEKVLLGLKWVSEYCSDASRVIKADDDTFLHVPRLLKAILSKPATSLIWGFSSGSLVTVRGDSKYAVSKEAYPFANYPYHVKGGMYVLPGEAIPRMVAIAPYLPYNNLEDVHVTGTLARALGIRHQAFTTREKLEPSDQDPCIFEQFKQGIFCVHIKSVNFPYRIWNKISDPRSCGKYD